MMTLRRRRCNVTEDELQALISEEQAARGFLITSRSPAWLSWFPNAPEHRVDVGVYSEFSASPIGEPVAIEWRKDVAEVGPHRVLGDERQARFLIEDVERAIKGKRTVDEVAEALIKAGYAAVDMEAVSPAFSDQPHDVAGVYRDPIDVPGSALFALVGPHADRTLRFLERLDALVTDLNALGLPAEDIRDEATIYGYDQNQELAEYGAIDRERAETIGGAPFEALSKLCSATGYWLLSAGDDAEKALRLTGLADRLSETPDGRAVIPLPYPIDSVELLVEGDASKIVPEGFGLQLSDVVQRHGLLLSEEQGALVVRLD